MRKIILVLLAVLLLTGCSRTVKKLPTEAVTEQPTKINESSVPVSIPTELKDTAESVTVSFDYSRASTHASNQIAIWVEDENGRLIKTLFVTDFTAARRGYLDREDALSRWVSIANPDGMSDSELDAVSSATPAEGSLNYIWNMTNDVGERVQDGRYTICLEITLYWTSNVLYTAQINTADPISGDLEFTETRSEPDNAQNAEMIQNVKFTVATSSVGK